MSMRNNFFTLKVMEPWNRLPMEEVASPSLGMLKAHLNAFLCDLLEGTCFNRGARLGQL